MSETISGCDISLTIPYEFNDTALTLTNFRYTVYDAAGEVLLGPIDDPDFDAGNSESTITIDGALNVTTEKYDARSVACQLITTGGTYQVTVYYEILGDVMKLTPITDSFMTFAEAILARKRISEPMDYYDSLDDQTKAMVLENAFERLLDLKYNLGDTYTRQCIYKISELTLEQFNALDPKLIDALKKAQIAEANHIVEVNPVKDKIRMGVISETIGESSMFFKQNLIDNKSYWPGISDGAYPYLAKFLYNDRTNAQIWRVRRS